MTLKRKNQGGRPCIGIVPLTNAERQARYRKAHPEYKQEHARYMRFWKYLKRLNGLAQQEPKEK